MRSILFGLVLALAPFAANAAPNMLALDAAPAPVAQATLSFAMASGNMNSAKAAGCVHLTAASVTSNSFPNLPNGTVAALRFYYGQGDASTVNQSSSFVVSNLMTDAQGNMSISPIEFCGLAAGHTSFRYGLADATGNVLEFQPDSAFDPAANVVDIQ